MSSIYVVNGTARELPCKAVAGENETAVSMLKNYEELYCLHGGVCRRMLMDKADTPSPFCICEKGYYGKRCELMEFVEKYLPVLRHLTTEQTALIVAGVAVLLLGSCFIFAYFYHRKKKREGKNSMHAFITPSEGTDMSSDLPTPSTADIQRRCHFPDQNGNSQHISTREVEIPLKNVSTLRPSSFHLQNEDLIGKDAAGRLNLLPAVSPAQHSAKNVTDSFLAPCEDKVFGFSSLPRRTVPDGTGEFEGACHERKFSLDQMRFGTMDRNKKFRERLSAREEDSEERI